VEWQGDDRRRRGGHHRRNNNDDAEEGGHIIAGTKAMMDTDAANITAGTTLRGEDGAMALSGGQSRVCVDFDQPSPSSMLAIVAVID
jgi:hypothetical protein